MKVHICEKCGGLVKDSDKFCSECGALFDKAESVKVQITKKDVDTISAYLNMLLGNRILFKDVMKFLRSKLRAYGGQSDTIDLRNTFTWESGKME